MANHPFSRCVSQGVAASLMVLCCAGLAACRGPNEQAGREQDKSAAELRGETYSGSGPDQRIGEASDRAVAADQKLRTAQGKVLEAHLKSSEVPTSMRLVSMNSREQSEMLHRRAQAFWKARQAPCKNRRRLAHPADCRASGLQSCPPGG